MKKLLELLVERLNRKLHKAEQAYVRQKTVKCTMNCLHAGRRLGDKINHCKINAQGNDELTASQCWDEKATTCSLYELSKSPALLKQEFRSLPTDEIALRWPSIGELLWMKRQIEEAAKKEQSNDDGRPISERSCHEESRETTQD